MLIRVVLVALLAIPLACMAQGKVENLEVIQNPVWFRAAFMGSIIYPGIALGIEYPLKTKVYGKGSDYSKIAKVKQRSLTGNLGWYHHKNYHDNFMFSAGYLMRRTNKKGWFTDFEPQLGISRTLIAGTTYTVDVNNNVQQKKFVGDWFFATKLSFSIGKDLSYKTSKGWPLKIFMRPSLVALLPYNNFIYVRPTLEIGAIYSFNNTWIVWSKKENIGKGKTNE